MKAIKEVGIRRVIRFALTSFAGWIIGVTPTPLRASALRLFGAKVGKNSIILPIHFINLDRVGLKGLKIGDDCYMGHGALIDLAEAIEIGDQVTFGPRVTLLSHLNVGYKDHPLIDKFPAKTAPVTIRSGSFVGANAVVTCGVTVGGKTFVAAGAVVTNNTNANDVVGGVPAKSINNL